VDVVDKEKTMKKAILALALVGLFTVACSSEADTASYNVSRAADQFEVNRRIHFYNGIIGEDFLVIEGLCSLGNFDAQGELSVTCKIGQNSYIKLFLGLSDNVTYYTEQLEASTVDPYRYRYIVRPESLIPDVDIITRGNSD
jgi:hypothetical protein